MKLNDKVQKALSSVLEAFKSGDIPEAIATTVIPRSMDIPSSAWSLSNRLILLFSQSDDARGFRQWKEVGRYPKKGSKAIHIISPRHRKKKDAESEDDKLILTGFAPVPVFRVEDTDGDPIETPDYTPPQPPPLMDIAQKWGIKISYQSFQGKTLGFYQPQSNSITLCTHQEQTFYHELSHSAHNRFKKLKSGQDWKQEVVAELTASVLAKIYNDTPNIGSSYQYIDEYANKAGLDVHRACLSVLSDTERCLKLILDETEPLAQVA